MSLLHYLLVGSAALLSVNAAAQQTQVPAPLTIQCQGPDGTFLMQTNPQIGAVAFKLNQKGHLIQGNTKIKPGPNMKSTFSQFTEPPSQYDGQWLEVKNIVQKNVFVPAHDVCFQGRSPLPCYHKFHIPDHYEFQDVYGVDSDFIGNPDGTYSVGVIVLKGTDEQGIVPVGKPNKCIVKGL